MRQRQAAAASGGQPPHETYQAAIYALRDVLTHCYRTSTDRSGLRKIQQRESAKGRDSASHLANTPGLPEAPGGLRIGSPLLPEGRAPQPRRGLAARSQWGCTSSSRHSAQRTRGPDATSHGLVRQRQEEASQGAIQAGAHAAEDARGPPTGRTNVAERLVRRTPAAKPPRQHLRRVRVLLRRWHGDDRRGDAGDITAWLF